MARIQHFGQQKSLLYNTRSQTWSHTGPRHLVAFIQGDRVNVQNNYWGSHCCDDCCYTMSSSEKKWYSWGTLLNGLADILENLHIKPKKKTVPTTQTEPVKKKEEPQGTRQNPTPAPVATISKTTDTVVTQGTSTVTVDPQFRTGHDERGDFKEYRQMWQFCSSFQSSDVDAIPYDRMTKEQKKDFRNEVRKQLLDGADGYDGRNAQQLNPETQTVTWNNHVYKFNVKYYNTLPRQKEYITEGDNNIRTHHINGQATEGSSTSTTTYTASVTRTDDKGNETTTNVNMDGITNDTDARIRFKDETGVDASTVEITDNTPSS